MRNPAGELHDLLTARDLPERVGDHLAVLRGDDLGQLTLALVEQLTKREQNLGALGQRRVPPARERRGGGIDHRAGILNTGQRHPTRHLTRRRIHHRRSIAAATRERLVVDPMRNGLAHGYFPYFET
jgi:hypothetical protein